MYIRLDKTFYEHHSCQQIILYYDYTKHKDGYVLLVLYKACHISTYFTSHMTLIVMYHLFLL